MKHEAMKRFANENVVGQRLDGLFFEGRVEECSGALQVVPDDTFQRTVQSDEVRWLVRACRYC